MFKSKKSTVDDQSAPIVVLIGGILGLIAAFMLSNDAVVLAKNSHAALSCSLNLVVNCSTVAESAAATLFGFPNSFIGLAAMPVLITVAVLMLARVKLPEWFLRCFVGGVVMGLIFAAWMFFQSFVVIGVLCPWCLTTDLGMILVAFGAFRYMARGEHWFGANTRVQQFSRQGYDLLVTLSIIVLIVFIIFLKFGNALFA